MTAIVSPATQAQIQPDFGHAYVFAARAAAVELAEMLNVLGLGLVDLWGDFAQTGSDVIRVERIGGFGWAEAYTELAGEVDPIVRTGFTTGFDTVALARHGLGKSESYQQGVTTRQPAVLLEALMRKLPESVLKTLRVKVAAAGATFAGSVGTTGTPWTFDDELAARAFFNETEGFQGLANTIRHPEVYSDLLNSIRSEPGLQFPQVILELQRLRPEGGAFPFLGFDNFASHDIEDSGGDHQSFAYAPGAIGWAKASTASLATKVEDPDKALIVPDIGMIAEWSSDGNVATAAWDSNLWCGVGTADPVVAPQTKLISIND